MSKVRLMTTVYNGLSASEKARALFVAVGKSSLASSNSAFCQGAFPAVTGDAWWAAWAAEQRDVVILRKVEQDSWEVYCKFSMNTYSDDFGSVVKSLLNGANSTSSSGMQAADTATFLSGHAACYPSIAIKPAFEELAQRMSHCDFYYIDADQNTIIRDRFKVDAMPTTLLLLDKETKGLIIGANLDKVEEEIEKALKPREDEDF